MQLKVLDYEFSICKLTSPNVIDLSSRFTFIGISDKEVSLVCRTNFAPTETLAREDGWRAFRIEGVLDFSLIGVISSISKLLANENVSMFAVSTFDTDYFLVKSENLQKALLALENNGYSIV